MPCMLSLFPYTLYMKIEVCFFLLGNMQNTSFKQMNMAYKVKN